MTQLASVSDRGTGGQLAVLAIKAALLVIIVMGLQLVSVVLGCNSQGIPLSIENEYEITIGQCDEIVRVDPQILYFGDSTVYPVRVDEDDRRSTPKMLADLLPEWRLKGFYAVGLTPVFFEASLDYFSRQGCRPDVVILPINVRAFSSAWLKDPRLQFAEIRSFLKHDSNVFRAFYRPIQAVNFFEPQPITGSQYFFSVQAEVAESPAYADFTASINGSRRLTQLRDFAFYGTPISENNALLSTLLTIRGTVNRLNAQLVCYITPVDFQNIETHLGSRVSEIARNNTLFLDEWMRERDFLVLNLANALGPESTHPVEVTSSHLNARGRQQVANRLNEFMKQQGILGAP